MPVGILLDSGLRGALGCFSEREIGYRVKTQNNLVIFFIEKFRPALSKGYLFFIFQLSRLSPIITVMINSVSEYRS